MTSPSRTYNLLLACACIWCMLIIIPVAQVLQHPFISSVAVAIDRSFATVCHQIDSRSFHIMGFRLAVCGRCASIYGGFLAGIVLWRIAGRRPPRSHLAWWSWALAPMLLDVFLDVAGIYSGGSLTRALTGAWFGLTAGIIITPLFIQGWGEFTVSIMRQPARAYESTTE